MSLRSILSSFFMVLLTLCQPCIALIQPTTNSLSRLTAGSSSLKVSTTATTSLGLVFESKVSTVSAFVLANVPLSVMAVIVDDNYEYGKVDAPIGLAWGVGVLAILTALLPIALKGGEQAFEEMRDRDAGTFGKSTEDVLKKRK